MWAGVGVSRVNNWKMVLGLGQAQLPISLTRTPLYILYHIVWPTQIQQSPSFTHRR